MNFWDWPGTHFAEPVGNGTLAVGFGLVPPATLGRGMGIEAWVVQFAHVQVVSSSGINESQ